MINIKDIQETTATVQLDRIESKINKIEHDIETYSKRGINECKAEFSEELYCKKDIKKVREYFKELGFSCSFIYYACPYWYFTISW